MLKIFTAAIICAVAQVAYAAPPLGPHCQTFVSAMGDVLKFTSGDRVTYERMGAEAEACETAYVGGEDDYEPSIQIRCQADVAVHGIGEEATFQTSYFDPRLIFRGTEFHRTCN